MYINMNNIIILGIIINLILIIEKSFVFSERTNSENTDCSRLFNEKDSIIKTYPDKIDITNGKVNRFQKDAFKNMSSSSIKTLQLDLGNVELYIEQLAFLDLEKLENLEISSASVLLDPDIFYGLNNLKYLKIQIANKTTKYLDDVLMKHFNLNKLEFLNHYNADICNIKNGNNYLNIIQLQYTGGYIKKLIRESFICLKNLQQLTITESYLTFIMPGAFDGLVNLKTLSLISNVKLTHIPVNVFNIKSLNIIDLSNNSINKIDNRALVIENNKLSLLNLSYNSLEIIEEGIFQNVQYNLIDLTQSEIVAVVDGAFNYSDINEIYFFKNQFFDINISKWGINSKTSLVYIDYRISDVTMGLNNKNTQITTRPNKLVIFKKSGICYYSEHRYFQICQTKDKKLQLVSGLVNDNYQPQTFEITDDISSIEDNTFNNMNIKNLIITSNAKNFTLSSDSFKELEKLEVLTLNTEPIKIYGYIFNHLKSLKFLKIRVNEFEIFSDISFPQLLSKINFINNLILTYQSRVIICVGTLDLDNNIEITRLEYKYGTFTNLPQMIFSCLNKLEYLGIKNSQLETISPGAFNGLDKLKSLTLSSNKLTHIDRNIFEKLINLNSLILRNNKINKIDDKTFEKQTLLTLDLSYNELKFISKYTFYGVKCKRLDLSNNKLTSIETGTFKNINLESLYVKNNDELIKNFIAWSVDEFKIQTDCIIQGILQICTKLNSLSSVDVIIHDFSPEFPLPSSKLELSGISSIGRNAFNNSNINAYFKVLEIHYTENHEFTIYPESFEGLINLEDLILNVGAITLTSNLFDKLKSLKYLKIQVIETVQYLSQILINLKSLRSLEIIGNKTVGICRNVYSKYISNSITDIRYINGEIDELPENLFICMPQIEILTITKTDLMTIQAGAFNLLVNVKYINLSFNKITFIAMSVFNYLKNLNVLLLNNNEIEDIDDEAFMLYDNKNLNFYNLSHNELTTIGKDTFDGIKSSHLDLTHNNISFIETGAFEGCHIQNLFLYGNNDIHRIKEAWGISSSATVNLRNIIYFNIYCLTESKIKTTISCEVCPLMCVPKNLLIPRLG